MQKTLIYIAILAVLGFGVWYFLFSDRKVGEAGFTISDTASIGKIFIAPNDNDKTITLERRATGWVVNNEYPVLQSSLKQLLTTIHNQRALYPVPDNQRDGVVRSLIGAGIKVEIYDRDGRKMRSFVVQIPGFEGYLTTRFSADLATWRDRMVFDYQPDEIEEVEVRYPAQPADNFMIVNKDGKLDVRLDPALRPVDGINQRRVNSFLGFFRKMYNENYQSYPGLDTVIAAMPELATVRVKSNTGRETSVRFIYFPIERGHYGSEGAPGESPYDKDRYYAIMNNGRDTATVQIPIFDRLFRRGMEFYTPDQKGRVKIPGMDN
jgi:hypothetical protein